MNYFSVLTKLFMSRLINFLSDVKYLKRNSRYTHATGVRITTENVDVSKLKAEFQSQLFSE